MPKDISEYPNVLTVKEACEILRIGRRALYRLLNDGQIANRMIAGKYLIPKSSVSKFIGAIHDDLRYNINSGNSDALISKEGV